LKCQEIQEWMQRELDGDLNELEKKRLDAHMSQCHDCAGMYHRLHMLSLGLEQLPKVEPPYSIVDSILPRLNEIELVPILESHNGEQTEPHVQSVRRSKWSYRYGWVAATILLAAGIYTFAQEGLVPSAGSSNNEAAKMESSSLALDAAPNAQLEDDKNSTRIKGFGTATEVPADSAADSSNTYSMAASPAEQRLPSPDEKFVGVIQGQQVMIQDLQGNVVYSSMIERMPEDQIMLERWSDGGRSLIYSITTADGVRSEWELDASNGKETKLSR
jgi:hypothetical protein